MNEFQKKYIDVDDKVELNKLFQQYYHSLCFFAGKYLNDIAEVKDTVQDVFVNLCEKKIVFKDSRAIKSYLYKSVYNSCMNKLRIDTLHSNVEKKIADETEELSHSNYLNDRIETEVLLEIFEAVESLPQECRKIFKLSYISGYDIESVARELNISEHTVRSQRTRAKKILRASLKDIFLLSVLWRSKGSSKKN